MGARMAATPRIGDAGAHIGGARKDAPGPPPAATPASARRKADLWPAPDWAALVAGGIEPAVGLLLHRIWAGVPATLPARRWIDPARCQADYERLVLQVRRECEAVRTEADLRGLFGRLGWFDARRDRFVEPLQVLTNRVVLAVQVDAGKLAEARREAARTGWPSPRKTGTAGPRLHASIPARPQPGSVERAGLPDWRAGAPTRPEDLIEAFGFRAVEFGEWVGQAERQQFLDWAHDALRDLARVLRWEPRALSLGGALAIAFGSRGHGGARGGVAHYEPDRRVINMTRLKGAGSLAHEFGHALDHALALAGWPAECGGWKRPYASALPPASGPSRTCAAANRAAGLARAMRWWGGGAAKFDPGLPRGFLSREFGALLLSGDPMRREAGSSGFLRAAREMDGASPYWSLPWELFARGFESFVSDSLAREGAANTYLVHGAANGPDWGPHRPFPEGRERANYRGWARLMVDACARDGLFAPAPAAAA